MTHSNGNNVAVTWFLFVLVVLMLMRSPPVARSGECLLSGPRFHSELVKGGSQLVVMPTLNSHESQVVIIETRSKLGR